MKPKQKLKKSVSFRFKNGIERLTTLFSIRRLPFFYLRETSRKTLKKTSQNYLKIEKKVGLIMKLLSRIKRDEQKILNQSLNQMGDQGLHLIKVFIWYKKYLRKIFNQNSRIVFKSIYEVSTTISSSLSTRFGQWKPWTWEVRVDTRRAVNYFEAAFLVLFLISKVLVLTAKTITKFLEKIEIDLEMPRPYRLSLQRALSAVIIFFVVVSTLYIPQSLFSNIPNASADVGHDVTSEFPSNLTTGCTVSPCSYTHTPSGTPRGVLIFVYTLLQTADVVTGVTYGGVNALAVSGGSATDTLTEPGRVTAYFLGSSVPTGAQTVSVTKSSAAVSIYITTTTITSSVPYNLETTGVTLQQENAAIAESAITDSSPGTNSMRFAGCYSGGTTISAGANSTLVQSMAISTTAFAATVRETTAGQGSRNVGCVAGNDDRAVVSLAVREVSTTIGNGTDSTTAPTIGPGGSQTEIDRFSLATTSSTDSVTGMTVTLSPANAFNNVASVEVKTTGGVSKCIQNTVTSNTVSLTSCATTVTTSSTEYVVYVTPKSHANMPAVPGASFATTATVTAITASNNTNGSDTGSDTVTIDNLSPNGAISTSGSVSDANVTLNWTSSSSSDFQTTSGSIILRWTASTPGSDVPVEGSTYTAGNTIGTATVACVISSAASTAVSKIDGTGGSSGCTTSALTNGQAYSYKAFQLDTRGNYDAGTTFTGSPFTPTAATTTLGDGTDSTAAATIGPAGSQTEIDRFSLATSVGTDTVTDLTVTLSPANAYTNISTVEVKTTGGVSKCSNSSLSSNAVALASCAIAVTTSSTEYVVYVTPKSHTNMPAVPGASFVTTATVTNWTGTNTHVGTDTDSDTVTIDNASPSDVASSTVSAGDAQNSLSWTNPVDSDFSQVVVLRRATSAVADVPVEGSTYSVGNTIGTATVACVTSSTSCTDTGLINSTAYHYKIFSKDSRGNYAAGVVPTGSPATPALTPVTTITTGTDATTTTVAPESGIVDAGTFTLSTNTGTDSITALTVTLAASGTPYNGASEVRITSSNGSVLYFAAISNPSSNTLNFSGGTPVPVTTTPTSFKIRITPKTHANMAVPPGASYDFSPYVSAFTSTNGQSGSDSNSNTLTIDNLSPANVTSASVSAGDAQNILAWTNPVDSDFSQVVVLRSTSAVADTPTEGATYSVGNTVGSSTVACATSSTSCTDTGLINSTAYHYKIFTKDSRGNYSATGVVPTGSPATPILTPVTTIATGTDAATTTIAPESGIRDGGTFTLSTNTGTDSITALTVTLAASGTPYDGVSEIRVTSSDGSTLYFAAVSSPSSNTVNFSGGTPIPVTTTPTSFKIRITPKTHANMAAVPGASYALSSYVSAFTSTNSQSGSDTNANTLTIDNTSPADVTSSAVSAGDAQSSLSWTNPVDSDFSQVVVLRRATSAVADVPVEGTTYSVGNTIGTATVACVTSSTSCTDTGLINSTAYHYKIFAKDSRGNYSVGVVPTGSPATPTLTPVTTISTGTDAASATVAPESAIRDAGTFTLSTNTGTDSLTALTVTLAASGTPYSGISEVRITSSDGTTLYFAAISDPSSNTLNFSGGTPIPVTTTPTSFKIRITPKTHANMAVPPGASYAVSSYVSAFTSSNGQSGTDSNANTLTIDNLSPSNPSASASPGDTQVDLDWTNPIDSDYATTIILKNTSSITDAPTEGLTPSEGATIGTSTVLYVGTGLSLSDTGLINDTTYYYKFFAQDSNGNFSDGVQVSAMPSLNPLAILGNGTDPSNATVEPGTSDIVLDAFTFRTNTGVDSITDLVVTTANTSAIVSVKIYSNDLVTQYYSTVTVPSGNTWTFTGGTIIDLTTTGTTYKIVIAVKSHAALSSANFAVTGRVTSFTSTNTQSGSDSASATMTVDNLAPADVTSASGTAGDSVVNLTWTNPADSDFASNIVLRSTSAVTNAPTAGSTYSVGNTIGSATVVCVTASTSCSDTTVVNNTAYHYKIFTKDNTNNYSAGLVPTGSPYTPTFISTTTIGNGVGPSDAAIAPGDAGVDADTFTLITNDSSDSITELTVTLASGTSVGISEISITSDDGLTTYYLAVSNPSSDTVSFSGGTPITATNSSVQYRIKIVPKSHADMPAPAGAVYAVTATATSFTSSYVHAGSDSTSATITIDNASPSNPGSSSGSASDGAVSLFWSNPSDSDFSNVVILRSTTAIIDVPEEGSSPALDDVIGSTTVVYISNGTSFTDSALTNGTAYYYKLFTKDANGNYSTGISPSGSPFTPAAVTVPTGGGGGGTPPSGTYPDQPQTEPQPQPAPEPTPTPLPPTPKITPTPSPTPKIVYPPTPEPSPEPEAESSVPTVSETKPLLQVSLPWTRWIEQTVIVINTTTDGIVLPISEFSIRIIKSLAGNFQQAYKNTRLTILKLSFQTRNYVIARFNKTTTTINYFAYSFQRSVSDFAHRTSLSLLNGKKTILSFYSDVNRVLAINAWKISETTSKTFADSKNIFSQAQRTIVSSWQSTSQKLVAIFRSTPKPSQIGETIVFRSGQLELIANQDQPIQSIVGFRFNAEVKPVGKALSVGGTFKFNDDDGDGIWTAAVSMPEVAGRFKINTKIAYADGQSKDLNSDVLIDPEGYVFEQLARGELRVAGAEVTLWHRHNGAWEVWPAKNYNQSNPQVTNQTGVYSFLAPQGEYYLQVTAEKYKTYRGESLKLETSSPIHAPIKLEYLGQ